MRTSKLHAALFASIAACAGCDDKPQTVASKADAAALSDKPAIDPDLAEAVQAASESAPAGKAARPREGEPPPSGVFAPGQADKELPVGAPAKITVGSDGSEPRVLLSEAQPKPGSKQRGTLKLQLTTGPNQGLPPMEFALSFQTQKAAAGAAEGASADQVDVVCSVTGVKLADAAGVPANISAELSKLKGSRVEYRVSRNGAGNDFRYTLAKGADEGLDNALRSLTESLATMTLPYPDKPLGNGAYFMAVTRERAVGVDVVAYRLVKVTGVKGNTVSMSVNTKRYATSTKFDMPGVPSDLGALTLEDFQSTADGTLEIEKGSPLPSQSELTQVLKAGIAAQKQPDQRLGLQAQARATFTLGGAPAAAR
jgi:hypothetical protein